METRANYVAVGAFVLVCIIGLFVAMLWLAGSQYREEYSYYRTYFNGAVTGLAKGTVVRYNGIDAGHVTDLAFDPTNPKRVFVTLQVDPTLRLRVDSVASIESQGFTGGSYLEITGGTATAPFLADTGEDGYPIIPSKPSTLQELAVTAPQLVARFNIVGQRLQDLLSDDNRAAFTQMLASLRDTAGVLGRHSADLDATLTNLKTASDGINQTLVGAQHTLNGVDQAVGSFNTTVVAANGAVAKLDRLSDDADKVVTGQGIAQMTQLVAQARALITSLTRLSNDFEREPTRIIYGDQRQGYVPK
jgi:phospholipid/cholesterol/gamma-HCH transport system substrate-binding protein